MIVKSESNKRVESANKRSSNRRWLRKKEAELHNNLSVVDSYDSKEFSWNKNCKKCYGRGYKGTDLLTKEKIPCKCLKKISVEALNQESVPL